MRWQTLTLLLFTLTTTSVLAEESECTCLWEGSFDEVQADTDLVVSATVVATKGNSIDLAVDERLRGNDERNDLRIWLQTGNYCRPEVELFPIGSQWVMALHRIKEIAPGGFNPNTPNFSYGRVDDYSLSSCGGYWLAQSGEVVTGNLVAAPRWVREPEMTPVLLELVQSYVKGEVDRDALLEASKEDPALRDLMLDTRAFLRGDED
ncbi:MAG: delta-aminolevulinic acid dehydratase [Halieaceae bacterium]